MRFVIVRIAAAVLAGLARPQRAMTCDVGGPTADGAPRAGTVTFLRTTVTVREIRWRIGEDAYRGPGMLLDSARVVGRMAGRGRPSAGRGRTAAGPAPG